MVIKLFIGGFPLEMNEMVLAQLVARHGDISTMKIVRDKKTRICKGYAFLEMVSEEAAAAVVAALHGEPIGDRTLNVKPVDVPQPTATAQQYKKVIQPATTEKKKRPRR
jgi:RNA recognition motif-containing protein